MIRSRVKTVRKGLSYIENPVFWAPFTDSGSGLLNTTLSRGTGSATFTRAGATATTILSTGLVSSTIAANAARSYYDPTTLQYLGGVFEEARTNRVLRSEDFSLAWAAVGTPTRSAAAKTCGALNMDLIGDDSAAALEGYTQAITYVGDGTKSVSVFFAQGTSTSSVIRLRDTTAPADRLLAAITWSGATPVITMTTGTNQGVDTFPNGVFRLRLLSTAVTAANVNSLEYYPATDNALAIGNTGNTYFGGMQSEDGAFATTYIPTAAASVTRAADVLTFPISGNIDQTVGSAFCRFFIAQQNPAIGQPLIANQLGAGNAQIYAPSGSSTQLSCFDGTSVVSSAAVADFRNTVTRAASTWGGATRAIYVNGAAKNTGAFDGDYNGTAIHIGCNAAAAQLNGCIRDIRIWQRVLSDSQIASIR